MKTKLGFTLGLVILSLHTHASSESPKSAKDFFAKKKITSFSGGAGNGGNSLVSEFFREGLIGLEALSFTLKITPEQKEQINLSMKKAKVYPVEFQLCEDNEDTSCKDDQAYAAKNYPSENTILVDSRKGALKWNMLSLKMKRRIAVHEFAGLSGIELSNHYFTSQIDDSRVFTDYKDRKELKKYFSLMNDLYHLLPPVPSYIYSGEWGKKTVLRPRKMEFTKNKVELLKGTKYRMHLNFINPRTNESVTFYDKSSGELITQENWVEERIPYIVDSSDQTYKDLQRAGYDVQYDYCGRGLVLDGEYLCHAPVEMKGIPRWRGRYKRLFEPSFPMVPTHTPVSMSCKALSEDDLLCRHAYYKKGNILTLGTFRYVYEYSFYKRLVNEEKEYLDARLNPKSCQAKLKKKIETIDGKASPLMTLAFLAGLPFGGIGAGIGAAVSGAAWIIITEPLENAYEAIEQAPGCNGKDLDRIFKKVSKENPALSHEEFCSRMVTADEDGSLCADQKRFTPTDIKNYF
jgi:hypothetical protein